MKLHIHHLRITWATSRGRDTYGYNICRLDDSETRKRYRTCGGGYDMMGTVFADWLEEVYQDRLKALVEARKGELQPYGNESLGWQQIPDLYGLFVRRDGTVRLDGACGIESMRRVAEALGFDVQWEGNRKGHTIGYFVSFPVAD